MSHNASQLERHVVGIQFWINFQTLMSLQFFGIFMKKCLCKIIMLILGKIILRSVKCSINSQGELGFGK